MQFLFRSPSCITMYKVLLIALIALAAIMCGKKHEEHTPIVHTAKSSVPVQQSRKEAARIVATEVPILCYHNFTANQNTAITLSQSRFEKQVRSLRDSGYHTILPDELYEHLTTGKPLPSKPVIISFDDTRKAQYTIAEPILQKYGYKGVFFIMTVCVDKPNYMSSADIKELAKCGNCVAAHSYDHPMMTRLNDNQWDKQLKKPKAFLEKTLDQPVDYFAYPYGAWTNMAIAELKKDGYKAAFQLSDRPPSAQDPLFTIRRLMVHGNWTAKELYEHMAATFPQAYF